MTCIAIKSLTFYHRKAEKPALKDINLTIRRGEYITLLGENGSGKSTLISCINGLFTPKRGAVTIFADNTELDPSNENHLEQIRAHIGAVMQNPDMQIIGSTVEDDTAFGPENQGLDETEIQERVAESLKAVGLEKLRNRQPKTLSGGEKHRLALAGSFALKPHILIFDEPTAMLDPLAAETILKLFDNLIEQGKTIIHITHSIDEARRSQRCLVLYRGALAFDAPPDELHNHPKIEEWGIADKNIFAEKENNAVFLDPNRIEETAVEFNALCYEYEKRQKKKENTDFACPALKDIFLSIPQNSMVAFIGPSGGGKTTLLKHINALLLPTSGTVRVNGENTLDKRVNLRNLRFKAALAIQSPENALFETYVADDVAFGARNKGLKGEILVKRVKNALETAGLPFEEFADREIASLSGGEKRRAALAGVLAMDSDILLLDEPIASLDNKNKRRVMEIIRALKAKGKTIIVTTHSREMAAVFDYVGIIKEGRLTEFGTPDAVFGNTPLSDTDSFRNITFPPADNRQTPAKYRRKQRASFRKNFFGQYSAEPSPLKKLSPAKKLISLLMLGVFALGGNLPISIGVLCFIFIIGGVFGRIRLSRLLGGIVSALPFIGLLVLFQLLFSWNDTSRILFQCPFLPFLSITAAEAYRSLSLLVRAVTIITAISLYLAVTPARETLRAVNALLSPLSRLGLPARDITMIITISLRFIPVLIEEAERIVTAQISRGGKRGLRGSLALIAPLLIRALECAETLANAMLLRLYKTGK